MKRVYHARVRLYYRQRVATSVACTQPLPQREHDTIRIARGDAIDVDREGADPEGGNRRGRSTAATGSEGSDRHSPRNTAIGGDSQASR
jgi:hypothetical protein